MTPPPTDSACTTPSGVHAARTASTHSTRDTLRRLEARMTPFLPFLRWFPMKRDNLRADLVAGITVALVLIPQSMAYAQLAGLPVVYGLYAAFIPVIVAALWGSSAQLHTGPTAMLSLLTAAALAPLATAGTSQYIALAIMLAMMVGVLRVLLGLFKMGVLVNFLSHPVIVGFTNAAALIIGLSQLSKLFNLPVTRESNFILEIWGVLVQIGDTHLPTLLMGMFALAIVLGIKRYAPRAPGILIAVVLTSLVSWAIGFEHNQRIAVDQITDPEVRGLVTALISEDRAIAQINSKITDRSKVLRKMERDNPRMERRGIALNAELQLLRLDLERITEKKRVQQQALRKYILVSTPVRAGQSPQYASMRDIEDDASGIPPANADRWRVQKVDADGVLLMGGGQVLGHISAGLPGFNLPSFHWDSMLSLLPSALVMALIGFMEAISISRAIAARTKQRIDTNRELVGQGLGNIAGSFFQSYVVSGSFSRSALNASAGARTGFAAVISALAVVVVLLFLTPLLYHLPQAVLAVIVMLAVAGLINIKALLQAWRVQKQDAIAGVSTFAATLLFAPQLEKGILLGAGLAVVLFMFRTMRPHIALLSRGPDNTLRDARAYDLPVSKHIVALRLDRSLYFANVAYFEEAVLQAIREFKNAKYVLVVGDGINELDASGEETLRKVYTELHNNGITLVFSGLKDEVVSVLQTTGLYGKIGAQHFFNNADVAIDTMHEWIELSDVELGFCPLRSHGHQKSESSVYPHEELKRAVPGF